jgi:uncharacterized membrane protein affecting hemolysin expression
MTVMGILVKMQLERGFTRIIGGRMPIKMSRTMSKHVNNVNYLLIDQNICHMVICLSLIYLKGILLLLLVHFRRANKEISTC